jgi:hypothetical protein
MGWCLSHHYFVEGISVATLVFSLGLLRGNTRFGSPGSLLRPEGIVFIEKELARGT